MTSRPRSRRSAEQLGRHRRVLGRALDEPERVLGAVDVDAEGDDTAVLAEVDAVDHERDEIEAGQVGREEPGEGVLRRGDEAAGDGRLRRAPRRRLDGGADRLEAGPVAAARELGEHPLHRELCQHVGT